MSYSTSNPQTRRVQQSALEVLKAFQKVCDEHHLTYFAIAGTCIGAVRHNGFIPWDDDIDVGMPYPDYKKLCELLSADGVGQYSLIDPHSCLHYTLPYAKLHDTKTTFIEDHARKYPDRYSGIFMDIFPIFGLPRGRVQRAVLPRIALLQDRLNLCMRFGIDEESSAAGRFLWCACAPLRPLLRYDHFITMQEKLFGAIPYDASDKVLFGWRPIPKPDSPFTYKNIFYYEDFSETISVPFEEISIMIPKGYDRYLTMDFGDYMQPPPVDEQKPIHSDALIDFEKPYRYYAEQTLSHL